MATKKKPSQKHEVYNYLRNNDHITSWVAMSVFKIMRLASRIDEIRNDLADSDIARVHTEMASDARGTRYARYRLVSARDPRFHDVEGCHILMDEAA